MAGAASEYGPVGKADVQDGEQAPASGGTSCSRNGGKGIVLFSVLLGIAGTAIALSSRGTALRASANRMIGMQTVQNEPYQCTWSYGEGVGSWESVWSDDQQKWCCDNKQLGCPTPPLFDCNEGYEDWQLGWSHIKKTWCCDRVKKGCSNQLCGNLEGPTSPKLFCASVIRPHGYEPKLMREQLKKCVHIFSCDDWAVVSDRTVWLSKEPLVETLAYGGDVPHLALIAGEAHNAKQYQGLWRMVKEDGRYKYSDWTVKTDPDAVFFPNRLKARFADSSFEAKVPTFFANCGADAKVGPHDGHSFLYGAIEVFSRAAVELLFKHGVGNCRTEAFEENMLSDCFTRLGVQINTEWSSVLLRDDTVACNMQTLPVCTSDMVAMHPFSGIDPWFKCWEEATMAQSASANQQSATTA